MSTDTNQIMQSNPQFTYAQAVGYAIGRTAAAMGQKFAGLSEKEWREAGDEYAHGYRKGYQDAERRKEPTSSFESWWASDGQYSCASGQDCHKETIRTAFLAGWLSRNPVVNELTEQMQSTVAELNSARDAVRAAYTEGQKRGYERGLLKEP